MRDVLDWLLPEAAPAEAARVRRLITALRLLRDDARAETVRAEGHARHGAEAELRGLERRQRALAFEGLLHSWLGALLPAGSFLDLGPPALAYEDALRLALDDAEVHDWLPRPGEEARSSLVRLARSAAGTALGTIERELWNARRVHALEGPARAEARWAEALRNARRAQAPLGAQARLLSGRVAARLDRFDPRGAFELLCGNEVLASLDAGLCRLFAWSALACGHERAWCELRAAAGDGGRRRPPAAEEMEQALGPVEAPEALESTGATGDPELVPPEGLPPVFPQPTTRRDLGAVVLGVFALQADTLEVRTLDAAPAIREEVQRRLRERDGAWRRPGEPEYELLRGAAPVRRDRSPGGALRGALGGRASLALSLVPIADAGGVPRGWIHVESEHHLLPDRTRLWALQAAQRSEVLSLLGASLSASSSSAIRRAPLTDDDPRVAFVAFAARTAWPARNGRRASLVCQTATGLCVLAERGAALENWPADPGQAGALRRAFETGLTTSYDTSGQGLHAAARAGHALPLALAGSGPTKVALVIESARRGDLSEPATEVEAQRARLLPAWRAAAFRAWHREHHGHDLAWDPACRFSREIEDLVLGAARVPTALLLFGAPGSGRRVLSRLVHFLGSNGEAPWLEDGRVSAAGGTRVIELAHMDLASQQHLAEELDDAAPRTVFLSTQSPTSLVASGLLAPGLARKLDPLVLELPHLSARRDEIPGLARCLAHERARREHLRPVCFADAALGHLWRQDWRGEIPQLDGVVGWLARRRPGTEIGADAVRSALGALRIAFRARLPSLRPRAPDLLLALASTRHANGSNNLARAARYLGWDPGTLERRLGEEGQDGCPAPDVR